MGSRLLAQTPVRLALYAALALILVWPALADAARLNEFRDSQVLMLYERAAVDTIRRFGELPLWNPFYCGGLDGLGAPQSRFASPTLLVSYFFGAERAELVLVFLFALAGMEGTYRWLRLRVSTAAAAAIVAPIFALSGQFSVAFYRGWTGFFGFELVPWILLGVTYAARGRTGGVALAAIAFALVLGFGGTFAAPLIAVAAFFEGLRALSERPHAERGRAFVMLMVTASFMMTLACFRLWPIAETLRAAPRIMAGTPGHAPKTLLEMLTGTLAAKENDVENPGSFFVGAPFLALVALGGAERRAIRSLVLAMLFVWLAAGYARKPALFALLRELPVFSALRYPERFLWIAILFGSEAAAHAVAKLPVIGEGRKWRFWTWAALGLAVTWSIAGQVAAFARVAGARKLGAVAPQHQPFHQARGNRWLAAHYEAMGIGSLSCWETHPVAESPLLRADLKEEEYLLEPDAGKVHRVSWSPNRIVVDAALDRPARLLVNQNWHPGWRASDGAVVSNDGLLAVDLPAGARVVTIAFRPWSAIAGAAVSGVALLALGLLALRERRGHAPARGRSLRATLAFAALPCAAFGAAWAMNPEPTWLPRAPWNANGTPALVAEAPPSATPNDAKFDLALTLEAYSVAGPDARANLAIDLWLRRTGAIARSTAMFVHVQRREGGVLPKDARDGYNADHQVVGGSFYLSDVPEGPLVHDAFGVHLDKAASGTWDVFVAFGHVSGRRGRAAVSLPSGSRAIVDEDRVRIATFVVP